MVIFLAKSGKSLQVANTSLDNENIFIIIVVDKIRYKIATAILLKVVVSVTLSSVICSWICIGFIS